MLLTDLNGHHDIYHTYQWHLVTATIVITSITVNLHLYKVFVLFPVWRQDPNDVGFLGT